MVYLIPLDLLTVVPVSAVIDKFLLDFDLIDLVFWYPRLTWAELAKATGAMVACKCVTDQIEGWALAPIKRRLKARLATRLDARWPRLAKWLGRQTHKP